MDFSSFFHLFAESGTTKSPLSHVFPKVPTIEKRRACRLGIARHNSSRSVIPAPQSSCLAPLHPICPLTPASPIKCTQELRISRARLLRSSKVVSSIVNERQEKTAMHMNRNIAEPASLEDVAHESPSRSLSVSPVCSSPLPANGPEDR